MSGQPGPEYRPVSEKHLMEQNGVGYLVQSTQKIFVIHDQFSLDEYLQLSEEDQSQTLMLLDTSVMRNNPSVLKLTMQMMATHKLEPGTILDKHMQFSILMKVSVWTST